MSTSLSPLNIVPLNMERFLEMTAQREQVVSANMANVDTPGYHAKDVSFEQTLMRASEADASLPIAIRDERGLMERPDGNNVDLDREGLLLAKAQLQYGLGVQLIKAQFHEVLSAINGGGQ
jgi:flagellar basal-body rod protein FlgB